MKPNLSGQELFSSECRVAVYAIRGSCISTKSYCDNLRSKTKGLLKYCSDVTVLTGTGLFLSERHRSDRNGHYDDITVPAGTGLFLSEQARLK
eukprot:12250625-Ditylum_brightwellii.AAC.1